MNQKNKTKIEAIDNMKSTNSTKEVILFLGLTSFYCRMWDKRADVIEMVKYVCYSKTTSKWEPVEYAVCDKTKIILI